jgi:hypothetical protein
MITARKVKASLVALAASFMCAAPAVHGAVYTWTDERGTRTYSNDLPDEPDKVRGFTVVEGIRPAPPASAREAPLVERAKDSATSMRETTPPRSASTRGPVKFGESFRPEPRGDNSAAAQEEAQTRELARIHARGRTETVRDPCLISSDPRCYERHKDRYHPYFGYAPSVTQPTPSSAAGATSATSAGGAVAGQVSREPAGLPAPRF